MSRAELASMLASAWEAKRKLADVVNVMVNDGWNLSAKPDNYRVEKKDYPRWLSIDLNGDGEDEWILTISRGEYYSICNVMSKDEPGELWIVGEQGIILRLAPAYTPAGWVAPPLILAHEDLTGDGLPDLVTEVNVCGMHTLSGIWHVISADHGPIRSVVQYNKLWRASANLRNLDLWEQVAGSYSEPGISFPNPDEPVIRRSSGLPVLVLAGGGYGSAGAGSVLGFTETWAWNGSGFVLTDIRVGVSKFRSHLLYEANFYFAIGDTKSAVEGYEMVISDNNLDNYAYWPTTSGIYDVARQFAAFRLSLLYQREPNETKALEWRDWLRANYPGKPLTVAGEMLISAWQETGDLRASCIAVTNYLKTQKNPTEELVDTGYGNPSLKAEDVCAVTEIE